MKKVFIMASAFVTLSAAAQKKPAPVKKTTTTAPSPLKTLSDSASYAIGVSVANFYSQQGVSTLNASLVAKAINDVLGKKNVLLNDNQANSVMMQYMSKAQESKAKPNIEAGQKFLAQNKVKTGVKTTASGLQYEVIKEGTGPKPTTADTVTVHYVGTLINGNEFDNSLKRGEPISFPVTGVIRGWTEALQLMPEGSKYKLYIPHQLAYGPNDNGPIPGGSVLVFEVELLKVSGKQ
ncbi:MAG TPA: FKBP-type peptidyl-prolyl cis-trans isomerase [Flavisolibacter sp.]|nr:FKBP-type peptidyl-prolyl cis-trans isomerase [Flavisolibacter sp.]